MATTETNAHAPKKETMGINHQEEAYYSLLPQIEK